MVTQWFTKNGTRPRPNDLTPPEEFTKIRARHEVLSRRLEELRTESGNYPVAVDAKADS